ncbi:branched-chain amino acid ABC transporter permease [Nocardioides sp. LHD-245]|uniref:branched-chain amino acid ABC transporter permease n=1 Tax=Nocardioides sp. LHD-245 TaxID=3051387 RepID=UPI0027E09C2B|nr:branched-chain amino acid ABC transporter permease [Nocardioides sp. LHD-245]
MIVAVVLVAAAAIFPALSDYSTTYLFAYILIIALLGLSLHLLMGLMGVFSLGQAALFGTGAYAAVVVTEDLGLDGAIGFVLVAAVGAVLGLLMGAVTLRVTDLYLALTTLAVGYIFENVVRNSDWLGGPQGRSGFSIMFFGRSLDDPRLLCWIGLGALTLFLAVIASMRRSKIGRAFMATRESPMAARSIGVDARRYKLLGFTIAGAFSAVAGGLYSAWSLVVDPSVYSIDLTLSVLAIAIVGGLRSAPGILVVAAALTYFRNSAGDFGVSDYVLLVYGSLIVLSLRFLPLGLGGLASSPAVVRLVGRSGRRGRGGAA